MSDAEADGHFAQAQWRELADQLNAGQARVWRAFPAIELHEFSRAGSAPPYAL